MFTTVGSLSRLDCNVLPGKIVILLSFGLRRIRRITKS